MWRLLVIFALVLQPMTLLRADCAGSHAPGTGTGTGTGIVADACCSAAGHCSVAAAPRHTGCCSGPSVCNCGEKQREHPAPAPAPSRTNGVDQVIVALQLPVRWIADIDRAGHRPLIPVESDVLLPATAAPHAFFCVWLT